MHFKNIFAQQNLFENLILLKTVDENFLKHGSAILHRSLSKIRISPQFSYERCQIENNPIWKCSIMIHNKVVSDSTATTKQSAKKAAIEVLLNELRRTCFTLEQKVKILSDGCTIDRTINENINETPISENNIGCKIMKLMGWKGGGLGKTEQGSCNPIVIHDHVHKSGFGANLAQFELMEKLKLKLQKYAEMDTNYDLVFSNDFSKNERAKLHVIARKLSLNTRSYGLSKDRYLVVSKRIANHQSILETLINCDGENEQYRLIPPLKLEVDSTDTNSIVI